MARDGHKCRVIVLLSLLYIKLLYKISGKARKEKKKDKDKRKMKILPIVLLHKGNL